MSAAVRRWLALWTALLTAVVCLVFLPVSQSVALLLTLLVWGGLAALLWLRRRAPTPEMAASLDNLPDARWRRPIVLVCGDLPAPWPDGSPVLTVDDGCWIRVKQEQELDHVARQLLRDRPDWGRQLSVMISVCPQQHQDQAALERHLLALRWQVSQLRRETGHAVPLILSAHVGSMMKRSDIWQAAVAGEPVSVWRESAAPISVASQVTTGGAMAIRQQILMNSLMTWFGSHVTAAFVRENPDMPVISPTAVLWRLGPALNGALPSSLWHDWLRQHTALNQVEGWQPSESAAPAGTLLPDFILPLLPEGRGLTPRQRAWRCGLTIFTLAAIVALCSSAWNNRQLIKRVTFDISHYQRIAMKDYGPKAEAVKTLRLDAAELDNHARNGEPSRLGLGLYQGERLRMPLLEAISSYVPPPPPPKPKPKPVPKIVRLDSMSLFDSGKSDLKTGSTKMLVNSLVGIKAKPGWLIVVSGHTDNTGNPQLNQTLSLKRAEAVRDWMRDTGDVPESCFAVQGYGESRPVANNDTPEGRAQNRRVEISLVPQANACQVPGVTTTSSQDDGASQHEME
ncbi:OmpA family protein [Jejubacter calystegiae]|uniref:OmpA family protein n=1 Tax=Jejubacter calystegiae TaxID=2579935 RepID=A0A4P8YJD9_9ENTR|nr:OmpA family protein [Jejubacter calystegiae]QCT20203.1 OmpA family protein [Jejubacter calystegiae]